MYDAFEHTHNEVDNLLVALNGKYVPPAPATAPIGTRQWCPTGYCPPAL
ncbi:cobaltochelatase subunit CobN [Gimesia sp.]